MKTGIAGTLVLPLVVMMLVISGCTSIQDHWTISDDQPQIAEVSIENASSSGPVDQGFAREAALPEREEVEQVEQMETEAQEEARGQEEALPEGEETEQVEAAEA
ncbi:MAG: hypothetical protein LBP80_05500 [Treponema sp.]|jgi:hypothetical protein|nr:hypothetical protein [Treponema sp.]